MANTGVGVGPGVGIQIGAEVGALVELAASASVGALAELRAELLATGDIAVEDEPELEEVEVGDRDDTELETSDEDAWEDESILNLATAGESWGEEGLRERPFELRVDSGSLSCEAPQSGWEGMVGRKQVGKAVLQKVTNRMACYRQMAAWLTAKYGESLAAGPDQFLRTYGEPKEQKAFLDVLRELGLELSPSAFSTYLAGAVLSWPDAVLPLRTLFK